MLFISSATPAKEISWWYDTPESPMPLACRTLNTHTFECELPENNLEPLLIKPCRVEAYHCDPYKRIDRQQETGIIWSVSGAGSLSITIPETYVVIETAIHLVDGHLIWKDEEVSSNHINILALKAGFYLLTVKLAQVIYQIPISVVE